MVSLRNQIAEKLFQTQSVKLQVSNPFTWASGILSPIYCDNRQLLSYPIHRDYIKSELSNVYLEHFSQAELIAGVATAGIAWGALIADQTKSPFVYVRGENKKHGLQKNIEGHLTEKQKVLVIEDLISTGKSSMAVIDILRANQVEVIGLLSIFSYGFKEAETLFQSQGVAYKSLLTYHELLDYAAEHNMFSETDMQSLRLWRENPQAWKPK